MGHLGTQETRLSADGINTEPPYELYAHQGCEPSFFKAATAHQCQLLITQQPILTTCIDSEAPVHNSLPDSI